MSKRTFNDPKDLHLVNLHHRVAEEGTHERIDMFFEASKWEGELKTCEPHKCDDLSWFSINKLPKDIIPYIRVVLESVEQHEMYSEHAFND